MELDAFKVSWNNQSHTKSHYNLNEILAQKVKSPIQLLKRKYLIQSILLPSVALMLTITNLVTPTLSNRPVVWIAVPVLLLLTYFYYRSYALIKKLEQPATTNIKTNLENQLKTLQLRGKQDLIFLRILLILFIAILELLMVKNLVPEYDTWEQTNFGIRIAVYAVLLLIQPYISSHFYNLNFGQHINKLKDLVSQAS